MNKLTKWLVKEKARRDISIREMSKMMGISHAHLAKVFRGEALVSWEFAAKVAQCFGLDLIEAFKMAGLWPNEKEGNEGETPLPSIRESHGSSVAQSSVLVTNGVAK